MALRKTEGEQVLANEDVGQAAGQTEVIEKDAMSSFIPGVAFEDEGDHEAVVAESEAAASVAIAKAQTTAVAAPAVKRTPIAALTSQHNVLDTSDIQALGHGAFPRITVDLGGFAVDKTKELGKEIRFKLLSYNERFMVVTGSNSEEAKKLVKISYDGVTIIGTGELVKDVVAAWKIDYPKATSKLYYDLWAYLTFADGKEIAVEDQSIHQIQLSPQSTGQFKAFQVNLGFKQKMKMIPAVTEEITIYARSEKKVIGTDTFGIVKFDLK